MDIIKLVVIFAVVVAVMKFNKPLYMSIGAGILATVILYLINPLDTVRLLVSGAFNTRTLNLILAFYSITFLQRMMEKRGHLLLAEKSLSNIFNSRRVNAMIAPFVIGLLPSAGAILIASPMVNNAAGDYLDMDEKTVVTSYFRHISEAFLPTYSSILLALQLSGIDMTAFVLAMLPMVLVLFIIGYVLYVRKIPKETGDEPSKDKALDTKNLIISLWPIALTIAIILIFKLTVHAAVIPVIILSFIINKFTIDEIKPFFKSAFEPRLIITMVVVMMFSQVIQHTGLIARLPAYFEQLPIPPAVIFAMIFFFGTLIAGSQAIIALAIPLAFATIPNGGIGLMILLMSMTYIAMQISPTHVCLAIITEENGTSFTGLVRKTMPILVIFTIVASVYSYVLFQIF